MSFNFGKLYKCPVCGKEFWVVDIERWVYKTNSIPMCSYTCYRTYQKEQEAKQKKKRKMKGG